jgi:hypothetical protein
VPIGHLGHFLPAQIEPALQVLELLFVFRVLELPGDSSVVNYLLTIGRSLIDVPDPVPCLERFEDSVDLEPSGVLGPSIVRCDVVKLIQEPDIWIEGSSTKSRSGSSPAAQNPMSVIL